MILRRTTAALALIFTLAFGGGASALHIEFESTTLAPDGRASRTKIFVANDADRMVALEIKGVTRRHDVTGTEHNESIARELAIFPKQLLLEPGTEKLVTVYWKGPRQLDGERAFRLVLEELPIDLLEDSGSGASGDRRTAVRVLSRVKKSFYVAPRGVASDLGVATSRVIADESGKASLELVLENRGNAHRILRDLTLDVELPATAAGALPPRRLHFDADAMGGAFNLLSKEKRILTLELPDWPGGAPSAPTTVRTVVH